MFFELLASAMLIPNTDLIAQNSQQNTQQVQTVADKTVVTDNVRYVYFLPEQNKTKYTEFVQVVENYYDSALQTVNEFRNRFKKEGQFLRWVNLPEEQLHKKINKSHLDSIYEQANTLSSRKGEMNRPLVVLGIGGSKHTAEFLLNMTGFDRKRQVYFYSDIDPISYANFLQQVGTGVENLNFLVVSKSGTTFETSDAFRRFENALIDYYQVHDNLNAQEALTKAQRHFALCTDATATEKNLRGKIGSKNGVDNGYIKELYIHDDVGGRYSMFDDAGLFVLAYAGVDKATTTRILQGAMVASKKCLNTRSLSQNPAVRGAIFNVFSRDNGYKMIQQQYFGKLFDGAGENWAKQLYLESLKDFDFAVGKAPDSMHYATEGHFSPQNRDKYNTIMTVMSTDISANYEKYIGAIAKTYSETTPLKVEVLAVEGNAIKPETIGEYIQTKHFETVYMGILRRNVLTASFETEKLPEILQPSVETYKNKFKPGSPYELNPGQ